MARKTDRPSGHPDAKKLARRIARLEKRVGSAAREEQRRARRLERTRKARAALEGRLAALRAGTEPVPTVVAEPVPPAAAEPAARATDAPTNGSRPVAPVDQAVDVDRPAEAPARDPGPQGGPSYERGPSY